MTSLPDELTIASDLVTLRDWQDADAPALAAVCGDPEITSFTTVPERYSRDAALGWIERQKDMRMTGKGLVLAIEPPGHGVAGNVNLVRFSADGSSAAMGYWVVRQKRGRGYARSAAAALCEWGFAELGLRTIEFAIAGANPASIAVALAVGASYDGVELITPIHESEPREFGVYRLHASDRRE
ncbi:MAG: GNAT family N-acetyltransferase [Solirubrobacterales bacterium]